MKAVTLKDVAKAAGVSVSTASRSLDERLPSSRSATAERVRAAAAELGYHRDATASALRRGDTSTVGVLVPRLSDTVMAVLFEAVFEAAAERGLFAMVSVCGDDPDDERRAADALLARRVDGLVLAAARLEDPLPASLRERGVPHVLALRTDGVSPSALCDDELGGYLATRHLIDLGHRRIAALPGPEFASTARDRLAGYRRALTEAGIEEDPALVRPSAFGATAGHSAATALPGGDERPTAVFAANDPLALGALASAAEAGLSVPEDLSVVGYNDIPESRELAVPVTTVHVPFDRIASDALDLLTAQSRGEALPDGTVRRSIPTLIPRRSTAPLR